MTRPSDRPDVRSLVFLLDGHARSGPFLARATVPEGHAGRLHEVLQAACAERAFDLLRLVAHAPLVPYGDIVSLLARVLLAQPAPTATEAGTFAPGSLDLVPLYLGEIPGVPREEILRRAALLLGGDGTDVSAAAILDHYRCRRVDLLANLLLAAARRPCVVLVEHPDAIDPGSLEVLSRVVHRLAEEGPPLSPLLFLVAGGGALPACLTDLPEGSRISIQDIDAGNPEAGAPVDWGARLAEGVISPSIRRLLEAASVWRAPFPVRTAIAMADPTGPSGLDAYHLLVRDGTFIEEAEDPMALPAPPRARFASSSLRELLLASLSRPVRVVHHLRAAHGYKKRRRRALQDLEEAPQYDNALGHVARNRLFEEIVWCAEEQAHHLLAAERPQDALQPLFEALDLLMHEGETCRDKGLSFGEEGSPLEVGLTLDRRPYFLLLEVSRRLQEFLPMALSRPAWPNQRMEMSEFGVQALLAMAETWEAQGGIRRAEAILGQARRLGSECHAPAVRASLLAQSANLAFRRCLLPEGRRQAALLLEEMKASKFAPKSSDTLAARLPSWPEVAPVRALRARCPELPTATPPLLALPSLPTSPRPPHEPEDDLLLEDESEVDDLDLDLAPVHARPIPSDAQALDEEIEHLLLSYANARSRDAADASLKRALLLCARLPDAETRRIRLAGMALNLLSTGPRVEHPEAALQELQDRIRAFGATLREAGDERLAESVALQELTLYLSGALPQDEGALRFDLLTREILDRARERQDLETLSHALALVFGHFEELSEKGAFPDELLPLRSWCERVREDLLTDARRLKEPAWSRALGAASPTPPSTAPKRRKARA